MHQRKFLLGLVALLSCMHLRAGEGEYAVSKIPTTLLKTANAVIRFEERFFEMAKEGRLYSKERLVITVLNAKGDKYASLAEHYDRFTEIRSIDGTLYDFTGGKIKSLKNKDIEDRSGVSEASLADDVRYKVHDFIYRTYPYTVEYVVEKVKSETMFFPAWLPVPDEYVAVEKSVLKLSVPPTYNARYKTFNYAAAPEITSAKEMKVYQWQVTNVPGIAKEYLSPGWAEITPCVFLAPSDFVIEDFRGAMTDWKELGKFQQTLNKGRDVLPENIRQRVATLIKDAPNEEEKVTRLYRFLQETTRYISIQLGIGGWRPLEASFVAAKLYGDCKALSNYMCALLKEAGIKGYYTLIKAGDDESDIMVDFPARQFNHAIVCVPLKNDTLWLECTSQTAAAGYMGSFTGNRHALLITDDGGKLVTTPFYKMKDNTQVRKIKATLSADAALTVQSTTKYSAMQQDDLHGMVNQLSKDRVKEVLEKGLDFSTYTIESFNYKETKSKLPVLEEQLEINVNSYATITGKRLFIIPNVMSRHQRKLMADTTRKYEVEFTYEYLDTDTVEINLPEGYVAESIPQDINISNLFGKYTASVKLAGNTLFYYRTMEHYAGRHPARAYAELVSFYEKIYKADRNKVVLVKKEETKGF